MSLRTTRRLGSATCMLPEYPTEWRVMQKEHVPSSWCYNQDITHCLSHRQTPTIPAIGFWRPTPQPSGTLKGPDHELSSTTSKQPQQAPAVQAQASTHGSHRTATATAKTRLACIHATSLTENKLRQLIRCSLHTLRYVKAYSQTKAGSSTMPVSRSRPHALRHSRASNTRTATAA